VAAQPHILRRALRWRRLRSLDEVWLVGGRPGECREWLTWGQKLRLGLPGSAKLRFFDAIFPPPDPQRFRALHQRIGIGEESYLLFAPGGGGYEHDGRPVPELFAEAAQRAQRETGACCVVVMGPLYRGGLHSLDGVALIDALEPAEMIDLLNGARLAVCGGGALLRQAVVLGRRCVGVPAGGSDQGERIRRFQREGLIEASPLDSDAIVRAVRGLLDDAGRPHDLLERGRRSPSRNGLSEAVRRLEALARRAGSGGRAS
jgi:hypothetical protein